MPDLGVRHSLVNLAKCLLDKQNQRKDLMRRDLSKKFYPFFPAPKQNRGRSSWFHDPGKVGCVGATDNDGIVLPAIRIRRSKLLFRAEADAPRAATNV